MEFNQAYDPFRALQTFWQALKKAPLPLIVGGVVLVITNGGGGGGGNFGTSFDQQNHEVDWHKLAPLLLGIGGLFCCLAIVFFVISSWVRIGFANTVEEVLRTGDGDVGRVFDGKGRIGAMVLSRLLCLVILVATFLPWVLVGVVAAMASESFETNQGLWIAVLIVGGIVWLPVFAYIGLGLELADQAVALEGLQPVDSVRRSWSLVRGHRWMLLWYWIVTGIFGMIGICACCIGIFLTGTMTEIAKSESFLALTRGGERESWWIQTGRAPSSPDAGWGSPPPPPPST